jgi:hypothetical protein
MVVTIIQLLKLAKVSSIDLDITCNKVITGVYPIIDYNN